MISRIIKKTVDLSKIQKVDQLEGPLYQLESGGHTFEITCLMDGAAASVSGTVSARFLRADEETVYFTGTLTGSVASVTLPQSCYNVNGRFGLVVFIAGNDITSAVYAVAGNVYRSTSDHIIDPTEEIPSLEDLIAKIGDCEDATEAANAAASTANAAAAAAVGNFAPDYANLTFPVEVGTHCTHSGTYYVANVQIDSSEAWTAAHWTQVTAGAEIEDVKNAIEDTEDRLAAQIVDSLVLSSATGNPIKLTDSATAILKSLTADGDCTVSVLGKNLLSADFEKVTWTNRADETIIYGKGTYEYNYPSRVTVTKCEDNTITLTPTSANVGTTGVGIFVEVLPSTVYTLSYNVSGSGTASVMRYGSEKNYIASKAESASSGFSFKTGETDAYVCISFRGTTQNEAVTFTDFQLEVGSPATAYTAYQEKQTVSVTSGTPANVTGIKSYAPVTNIYSPSNVTISVEYYSNSKAYIDGSIEDLHNNLISDIKANMFVSSYNQLDGWEDHAKAFSQMMFDVGNAEGFMFFTDTHFMAKQTESAWKEYAYAIFAYMEQLYYASPCSFVLHGGDWLGTGEAWSSIIYKLSTLGGIFRSRFDRFALLVGNHETGNQSEGNHTTTHGTLAATLLSNVGKTYYRFDANTFHLYCFDSWVSGAIDSYSKEQIKWFGHCLENETVEHIAIAIHILYDSGTLKPLGDELTKMAYAYNSGSAAYEYDGQTFNFSSHTGKVAFVIAGHEHGDASGTVNNIPYIMTTNTTGYSETNFSNLPLPVDLIRVDWTTGKLTAYRAARGATGTTRELNIIV